MKIDDDRAGRQTVEDAGELVVAAGPVVSPIGDETVDREDACAEPLGENLGDASGKSSGALRFPARWWRTACGATITSGEVAVRSTKCTEPGSPEPSYMFA